MLDVVFWGVIAGFLGARIAYILVNFEDFLRHPRALIFSRQGFVFLGGLLTALPVVALQLRRWRVRFWPMADLMAPPLALAHAFGRAGCFTAGCCYGAPTALPWGVRFPRFLEWKGTFHDLSNALISADGGIWTPGGDELVGVVTGSEVFVNQALTGVCQWTDTHALPVHPTQLYDVLIQLSIFALLMTLWRRRRFHGQIFLIYLWIYPITRIALETVRGDIQRGLWVFNLSTSQVLSGLMIAVALGLTVWKRRAFAPVSASVRVVQAGQGEVSSPVDAPQR